ncbi:glycosyltransferase [Vibrio profundum]|uniref:glycosyltransferase n=1 Tax=Vibrio profundum TaxID=2910247 RepID=UPI003D11B0BC
MKVLQVMVNSSAHAFAGGAQKVLVELGNNLSRRGNEVTSVYNDTAPGELFFKAKFGSKIINLNVKVEGKLHKFWKVLREIIKPLTNSRLGQYFPNPVQLERCRLLAKPLKRLVEIERPDVILAYEMRDHDSLSIGLANGSLQNIPIIHMVHSEVTSYYDRFNYIEKKRIKSCAAVQALTPSFASQLSELIGRDVNFIGNIVTPPNTFADLSATKLRRRVIMHSRLDPKKQQHILLESFALIKDEFPNWEVVIFGSGTTRGYLYKLQSIIDNNHMADQVTIHAPTSDVLYELSNSDIFAFPSIHEEGWGLALTEAMSVGLPCIGINSTSAIDYLISKTQSGLTTDNSPEDFSRALYKLMSNQDLRIKYGKNAKEGVKKYYADNVCQDWESLFEKVNKP